MISGQDFQPEWISAPGDTIAEILDARNLSAVDFARGIHRSQDSAEAILEGRAPITLAIARELQAFLGGSVEFWMSRDFQYRQDTERVRAAEKAWLHEVPVADMAKYGWLQQITPGFDEVEACMRFFDVSSVPEWHQKYAPVQEMVAFRTSPSFDSRPAAVAAWLRQGEIEAEAMVCAKWDAKGFRSALLAIRRLTRKKNPRFFVAELQKLCCECGVAVVIVRAPNGCRASGATRFVSSDKALLLLSARHLTDDQFWFTFFHEAGHLLLHARTKLFIDGADTLSSIEEVEANDFAATTLVPPDFEPRLSDVGTSALEVIRHASQLGVSPGIVVGQLQHLGVIGHNQLNKLKRRYRWAE